MTLFLFPWSFRFGWLLSQAKVELSSFQLPADGIMGCFLQIVFDRKPESVPFVSLYRAVSLSSSLKSKSLQRLWYQCLVSKRRSSVSEILQLLMVNNRSYWVEPVVGKAGWKIQRWSRRSVKRWFSRMQYLQQDKSLSPHQNPCP